MQRELKFRMPILNPDGSFKEWFYWGFGADTKEYEQGDEFTGPHSGYRKCPSQQFINSRDAALVDVYEGDILLAPSGRLMVVTWHENELRWVGYDKDDHLFNLNMGILRVIGNTTENLELLT